MKIFRKAVFLLCVAMTGHSYAQTVTPQTAANGTGTAQAGAQGGAVVFAPVSGDVNNKYSASSAVAPQLVAGLDTCMGSSSVGAQGPSFGVSIGTTWKDEDCRLIKNGREMWNMGMKAAALAILCTDDKMRYAVAVTGGLPYARDDGVVVHRPCPMTQDEWVTAGKPLLDPVTQTPLTNAQLNPPQRPANPLASLSPTERQQLLVQFQAEVTEQRAAQLQAQAMVAPAVDIPVVKPKKAKTAVKKVAADVASN